MPDSGLPMTGGCSCGTVRYRLEVAPMFVHCCHCRWCQRETGSGFALNALIEADRVLVRGPEPQVVRLPSESGRGQNVYRCRDCRVALWSHYAGHGERVRFVRVGTLDEPDLLAPDIHIYTISKQPWVELPRGAAAVPEYYDRAEHWPEDSLRRLAALGVSA